MSTADVVTHTGGCHCGAVRYEIKAPAEIHVYDCNCSICLKKQNRHFDVKRENFKLLRTSDFSDFHSGTSKSNMAAVDVVTHTGGCHCGAVRFEVKAPAEIHVYDCNCSICMKKQNRHFIVKHENFKLLQGEDQLTTYTYNTHTAKHKFCKICGVQSFYQPRSNPSGYGVMPHCLDPGTVTKMTVESFDGTKWETTMEEQKQRPLESSITKWA